jgi:hypothetical protein
MSKGNFVDLVIGGPDMSGTSTQVQNAIEYSQGQGKIVRDIRGTEIDALFHSREFQKEVRMHSSKIYLDFSQFLVRAERWQQSKVSLSSPNAFLKYVNKLLSGGGTNQDLRVASMIKNNVSTYIDPNSADVWIMEEPSKRGAGQVCRALEQNRSEYGDQMNPIAAAETHSVYRTDEFLRFRKPLRENGKIIIRSRSEESACYQIFDKDHLPNGVPIQYYLNLAGHKVAFANPPSHLFVVCGPENWTEKDYLEMKRERSGVGRFEDDHERNAPYQVLINRRYTTDWLDNLYKEGCSRTGADIPTITRFDIYDSKSEIKRKMNLELEKILAA